mgnify:CR=1 FL=1|jgi:hypothetical protein
MVTEEFKKHVHKSVNKLISELRSVAKIQYGNKWNTTTINPQENNIVTSIVRTLYYWHESRETTITYIENLISKSQTAMTNIQIILTESEDQDTFMKFSELRTRFVVAIAESYNGILNLAGAYNKNTSEDDDAREKIITLAEDINKLQQRYNSIGVTINPQARSLQT